MEPIEIEKIHAEIVAMSVLNNKLLAETANLNRATRFMPFKVFVGVIATISALAYVVFKFNALMVVS